MRSISEAVTKLGKADTTTIRNHLISNDFQLAGYKGRKLTYRTWNGQLRQPVPLFHDQALVTSAPFDGFLHPHNELDTLGIDRPQSQCRIFRQKDSL
ncbi:hypothetical protein [Veronia pacifica]|uniref:Uncharacterized protein n=1 Tax=Veronia pacifica TaxID=1080227 RepID=A0A1C3ED39_9GAMM|nr:hypothetical protein [Veronia pacifica]ODA31130.1 hypothetical protein A8L45_17900 [Veronia pacifica]